MKREYSKMKKFITVCLMILMLVSMSTFVFAENGGFIQSPSSNQAPELVEGENEADDCVAQILITAYADRENLSEEVRTKLEESYKEIMENANLSALNEELEEIAKDNGVKSTDFAVSDMFDITATHCESHDEHGHFDIVLKAETLKNFVCLLHYFNGEWHIVPDAKVTGNGEHLEFTAEEFSPFAIVVNTAAPGADEPQNNLTVAIYGIVIAVIALILLLLLGKKKKNNA